MASKACRVTFSKSKHGWEALLWDRGRVLNARNYPRSKKRLSAADRADARESLCAGLAQLRRDARRRR